MRLFKSLKERILKSIITWSTMGKQTAQAKEVYLVEVSEIKPGAGFFYEFNQLLEVEDIPNVTFTDYHLYALHCILFCQLLCLGFFDCFQVVNMKSFCCL